MTDDPFLRLHHLQLAIPRGGEPASRDYWVGLLGLTEVAKPAAMAARGGCWFRSDNGDFEVHMGVEEPFVPARKAHPAMIVDDVDDVATRLLEAGHDVRWSQEIPGTRRFHTDDPFGNRLEIIAVG
ncbi:MAG: glyoxalase [Dermatophilaceae bacterium]